MLMRECVDCMTSTGAKPVAPKCCCNARASLCSLVQVTRCEAARGKAGAAATMLTHMADEADMVADDYGKCRASLFILKVAVGVQT
jgi:hypothetical protein